VSEYVGRIPLVRRRRRKPPSPDELYAICICALSVVSAGVFTFLIVKGHHDPVVLIGGPVALIEVTLLFHFSAPVALPALRRWWWGE
jgi:hypothetical protein